MKFLTTFFMLVFLMSSYTGFSQVRNAGCPIAQVLDNGQYRMLLDQSQVERMAKSLEGFGDFDLQSFQMDKETVKGETTYYLVGKGMANDRPVLLRIMMDHYGPGLFFNHDYVWGEACKSVSCDRVVFKAGGGCECDMPAKMNDPQVVEHIVAGKQ